MPILSVIMNKLERTLFYVSLLLVSFYRCDDLVDKYHFTKLQLGQYIKHSDKYNLDLLVNFDDQVNYNTIGYDGASYRPVDFYIDDPEGISILTPTRRSSLKIADNITTALQQKFNCSNKTITDEGNAQTGINLRKLHKTNKYYFNRDPVLTLEMLLYNSYADSSLALPLVNQICFATISVAKEGDFEYFDNQVFIDVGDRTLQDVNEYINSLNEFLTPYSFTEFLTNHFRFLFILGNRVLMTDTQFMVVDTTKKINYAFTVDIDSFGTYLRTKEQILTLFNAPFKMYSDSYNDNDYQDKLVKFISSFYLMVMYSFFTKERTNITPLNSDPLWQSFMQDTFDYVYGVQLSGANNSSAAIAQYIIAMVQYIPLVAEYFADIFSKDDTSIEDKIQLLNPTFLDNDVDQPQVDILKADQVNHEVGKHLTGNSSFDLDTVSFLLDIINQHIDEDFQTILESTSRITVMCLAILSFMILMP